MSQNLVVLASGRGSNLQALIDAGFPIALVITDKENALALERAKKHGIPAEYINPKDFSHKEEYEAKLVEKIKEYHCTLVCLAGFMRILSPYFINNVNLKILNIHPSLLPSFPGLNAHQQALDYGVKFSGCTVHLVDEGVDSGPIIKQAVVPVFPDDTVDSLAERILVEEHRIYPLAVKLILEDKLTFQGRKVFVQKEGER